MSQDKEPQAQTGNANPTENGEVQASVEERKFSTSEVEQIVKARLAKEQKKHQKAIEEQKTQKSSGNVEEDLRSKLTKYESENQTMSERLTKLRNDSLRSMIEKKLAVEFNVLDPDLIADRFISKGLVRYDDDDSVFVENTKNDLDDLIRTELEKRPHLVKSMAKGGAGTKAPGAVKSPSNPDLSQMTSEEFANYKLQKYGIPPASGKKNWMTG